MAERELIFRTKVINDPSSTAALKELGALAEAVNAKMMAAMSMGAKGTLEAAKTAHFLAAAEKAAAGAIAERARAEAEAARAEGARLEITQKKAAELRRQAAEERRVAEQVSVAMGKQLKAQKDLIAGFEGAVNGAMLLGRGLAMAGLIGEDSLTKILNTMLKIQTAMDLAKGGAGIYFSIIKAAGAYGAIVNSATGGGAGGGGGDSGGSAGGALSAAGSAGSIAGGFGGVGAIAKAGGAIIGALGPIAIVAAAVVVAIAGVTAVIAYFSPTFRKFLENTIGALVGLDDVAKETAANMEKFNHAIQRSEEEREERARETADKFRGSAATQDFEARIAGLNFAGGAQVENRFAADQTRQQLQSVEREIQTARRGEDVTDSANRQVMLEQEKERLLRRSVSLGEDRLRMEQDRTKEMVDGAHEVVKARQEELRIAQQVTDHARNRLKTTEERLAGLNPLQARRVAEAANIASGGGSLSRQQANTLRGLGIGGDEAIRRSDQQQIKMLGLDHLLDPLRKEVSIAEMAESGAESRRGRAAGELRDAMYEENSALVKGMKDALHDTYKELIVQIRHVITEEGKVASRALQTRRAAEANAGKG